MRADDAWCAVAELAASQHGVTTRSEAASKHFDDERVRHAIRAGLLAEPVPRVLVLTGTPDTFQSRLMTAVKAGGGTVASHRAAALLHGFDGVDSAPIEVTVQRGRYPSIGGVVVHRATPLDSRDLTVVDGIPCTNVARTLCDLGAVMAQDDVERCLDGALRRGASPQWVEGALRRVHRPGPSGTPTLKRIVEDPRRAGGVPETWFERLLRRALAAPDIPPVVLQYELRAGGRIVARFDAAIPEWRIAVEAHSAEWHDRPGRVWRDLERDNHVKALGWDIVYVTWGLAKRPDDVLDLVRRTRRARSAS
jgi:hypothetical protein